MACVFTDTSIIAAAEIKSDVRIHCGCDSRDWK